MVSKFETDCCTYRVFPSTFPSTSVAFAKMQGTETIAFMESLDVIVVSVANKSNFKVVIKSAASAASLERLL